MSIEGGPAVRRVVTAALVAAIALAISPRFAGHEIPVDVTVQAFVKPEPRRLRLLVRVPLTAMRDVDVPTRGPGYLDLARAEPALRNAATLWITQAVELFEEDARLPAPRIAATRVSLPLDRSFATYEEALAHVNGPRLPDETELYWEQGLLDALIEYPIRSEHARFSVRPGLDRLGLRVSTVLRFLPPGGAVRAFELVGDPGLVRLDPRWHQAALRFVGLGFSHILDGVDHLLFLACLVIPLRRLRPLVLVVTSFTLAHSITLIASAFDMAPGALWFPPLVEALIAGSIVYMGLENVVAALDRRRSAASGPSAPPRFARRWVMAFAFGLVHGFGFSFALRETLQFAGSHLLTSLVSFNLGVELGQLLVIVALVPMIGLTFGRVWSERTGTIVLSALVVHTGWHWMVERGTQLRAYQFQWPVFDLLLLAVLMRWLLLVVIVAGLAWLSRIWLRHRAREAGRVLDVAGP